MKGYHKLPHILIMLRLLCGFIQDTKSEIKKSVGYFWQISDIHLDNYYTVTGDIRKNCHETNGMDIFAGEYPGSFGEYSCDTPISLVHSMVKAMLDFAGDEPDFVLWTGGTGTISKQGDDGTEDLLTAYQVIVNYINENLVDMKVYPCLGRSDFHPTGKHVTSNNRTCSLYNRLSRMFVNWIDDDTRWKFRMAGYYHVYDSDHNLRIVVLNTNFFMKDHVASFVKDPADQWSWLEGQLKDAREKKQNVYLVMSIPPGVFEKTGDHWFHPFHNHKYVALVRLYSDVIKGQFAGHYHTDSFRLVKDESLKKVVGLIFLAPSLAPRSMELSPVYVGNNNPGVRLYTYDVESGYVLDYTQYYLNITKANVNNRAIWERAYTFSYYYSLPNASARAFEMLVTRLREDKMAFARYYEANSVLLHEASTCNEECRTYHLCAITHLDYSRFRDCVSMVRHRHDVTDRVWGIHDQARPLIVCLGVLRWLLG